MSHAKNLNSSKETTFIEIEDLVCVNIIYAQTTESDEVKSQKTIYLLPQERTEFF